MGVNKVEYGGETLIDLTSDSVTPETLAEGVTAHDASGEQIVGILRLNKITDLTDTTWYIPSGWLASAGYGTFELDFNVAVHNTGTTNYTAKRIHLGYTIVTPLALEGGDSLVEAGYIANNILVSKLGFVDYREISNVYAFTVTFTGGTDVTNTNLINWLYTYGELQTQEPEIDLSAYQTKTDENLETESKEIVGAINEINAKIGTSTPSVSLIGTWTVIDEPEIPKSDLPLEFTCNGTEYMAIGTTSMGSSSWGINALSYQVKEAGYYDAAYTNNPSGSYGITHGWSDEAYKTITVTEEPTDPNAIAWLGANTDAPKIDTPLKPCFEMPQIRFTSATGSTDNDTTPNLFVDAENPLKLTVEIVGGGALQVGDQLQVCYRKRFNGSMANGFKRKYKLQRFAEYVVTEEDLDKQYLTVSVVCEYGSVDKMLHHAYRGLFHDGKAGEIAPLYLRIRRPKGGMQNNDSGQTVDAEFSNIVTIWKHSIRGIQTIRIQ